MSIGLDFILRANSAAFTKGLASANNAIKDVKKGLREFDVGNGLKQALGIGGIIAAFRSAITNAQELRDEADKIGKAVDSGTRSVAELGDAIAKIGGGFKNALTEGLSFFTRIGDKARQFFQGVTQDQEDAARKMVATTGKAADEAEARLKAAREANSPEKQAAAQEKLDKKKMESAVRGTDAQKKLANLVNEGAALEEKKAKAGKNTVAYKEAEAALLQNNMDMTEAAAAMDKEAKDKGDKKTKERSKLLDKVGLTVEELAAQDVGGFTAGNDPRLQARKALKLESQARAMGERGDIKQALSLQGQAEGIRKGLSGVSAESKVLTPDSARVAFQDALKDTNTNLKDLEKAVAGIIKAQK